MAKGQVKWFDAKKGFGFIAGSDERDVFVHYTQITGSGFKSLKDGQMVEYELKEGDRGLQAENVKPIDDGESAPASTGWVGSSE